MKRITAAIDRHFTATLVACVLVAFATLTLGLGRGGVSGASICEWNRILPDRTEDYRGGLIGRSRPVRVDEWAVSTPFIFAQCAAKEFFPRINPRVNGGTDMFIQTPCAPVWDWTAFGQFHNWGYFLFGADHGLAWCWWTRFLLLPLFAFLFFLKWCDGDRLLAFAGAVAVTLGSPTQWWDTTIPYYLVYFFSSLVFAQCIFAARSPAMAAAAGFGLFVSVSSYCFIMYPPFALLLLPPLAILAVFSCKRSGNGGGNRLRAAILSAALAGVAAEVAYFFTVHSGTLAAIGASSYPGDRIILGGSFKTICERAVLDWLAAWTPLTHGDTLPSGLNHCRAAEYIGLAVPLAVCLIHMALHGRRCRYLYCVTAWAAILLAWAAFTFPQWMAKATGFSQILPPRATVVAGFLAVVCAIRAARLSSGLASTWSVLLCGVAACLICRVVALWQANGLWKWFYASGERFWHLETAVILTTLAAIGLVGCRRRLFAISLMAFSAMQGLLVHPISMGISPMRDKVLTRTILDIDAKAPGRWIANDRVLAQLPMALGLDSYAGTQQYCDPAFWSPVDPDGLFRPAWNRYGHRFLLDLRGKEKPSNKGAPDCIFFSLEESAIRALGVRYVIWRGRRQNLAWLRHLASVRNDHIYEVSDPDGSRPRANRHHERE